MTSPVVAGYVRVSSTRQRDESDSPASQRQRLEAAGCTHIYQDLAVSGFKLNQRRKAAAFKQLQDDIAAGRIAKLLAVRLDRLARRDQIVIELAELCQQHDVEFSTLSGGLVNISTSSGWLQVKVQSIFGEHYSRALSESIRAGYDGLYRSGIPARSAASLPFHLQRIPGTRHGVEPSQHWDHARRAIDRLLIGAWTVPQAGGYLHERAGIRGDSSDIKRWLRSHAIAGHLARGKPPEIALRDVWPALVTDAEHGQLLALLEANRGQRFPINELAGLLTGICHCAICGGAMSYERVKRPSGTYRYIRCRRHFCNGTTVRVGPVWDVITQQLDEHLQQLVQHRALAAGVAEEPPEVGVWRRELAARQALPVELRQSADEKRVQELQRLIAAADTTPMAVEEWWPDGLAVGSVQFWSQRPEHEINADLRRLVAEVLVDPSTSAVVKTDWRF